MTFSKDLAFRPSPVDDTTQEYFNHSSAQRVSTDTVIVEALKRQYPQLELTIAPAGFCNLLGYAANGHAKATPLEDSKSPLSSSQKWRQYVPPARRIDHLQGAIVDKVLFGKYMYAWKDHEFVLYVVNGRDGLGSYPQIINNYILSSVEKHVIDELITKASRWTIELHNEVWVFDRGYWQKSAELWQSVQQSEWEDVILDSEMKKSIIEDAEHFFISRDTYTDLRVPWKRGVIYYGPPGNGKTVSIKAMMHTLSQRDDPIPTLFVRTLTSFAGPEYALGQIFAKARQEAPCYLVFEDLDSIVTDNVRSYFLNEVDGLKRNDGILMVGSTNHLDRLDPGIAKRPSRFDRKYFFPNPSLAERTTYCQYWQSKLASNDSVPFPDKLCPAIAGITNGFSFAYIQEAFVASLLTIASHKEESETPKPKLENGKQVEESRTPTKEKPTSKLHDWNTFYNALTEDAMREAFARAKADRGRRTQKRAWEGEMGGIRFPHVWEGGVDVDGKEISFEEMKLAGLAEEEEGKVVGGKGGEGSKDDSDGDGDGLDEYRLWREMKKQVKLLREGLEDEAEAEEKKKGKGMGKEVGIEMEKGGVRDKWAALGAVLNA